MKINVPVKKQPVAVKRQTPDMQRRINGGWLRLWKAVWPNTPPPVKVQSPKPNVQSPEADVRGSRFDVQGSKFSLSPSEPRPAAVGYLSRFQIGRAHV